MTRKGFAGLRSDRSSKHHSFLSPYTSSCRILRTKTRETERGTGNGDVLMCFLGVCIPIHTYSTDIHVHVLYIYIYMYICLHRPRFHAWELSKQASKQTFVCRRRICTKGSPCFTRVSFPSFRSVLFSYPLFSRRSSTIRATISSAGNIVLVALFFRLFFFYSSLIHVP